MGIREIQRRLPLAAKTVVVTVLVGVAVGFAAELYSDRLVGAMFGEHLQHLLDRQSQEDRLRFDHYTKSFHQVARLTVAQHRFREYVRSRNWFRDAGPRRAVAGGMPPWIINRSAMRALAVPRYVVLLDGAGRWLEAYSGAEPPPPALLLEPGPLLLEKSIGQAHITTIDGVPYLLSADGYESAAGKVTLLIASPIDDRLLLATQGDFPNRLVALLSGDGETVLTSSDPGLLAPGTPTEEARHLYVITGREYHDYGGAEMIVRISSFIPTAEVREMTRVFVGKEKRKGVVVSAAFILSFTLLMLLVSRRVGILTRQVEEFSTGALGGQGVTLPRGDGLDILEERFRMLRKEVVESHERIRAETEERIAGQLEMEKQQKMLALLRSVTEAIGVGVMISTGDDHVPVNSLMGGYERLVDNIAVFDVAGDGQAELRVPGGEGGERLFEVSSPFSFENGRVVLVNDVTLQRRAREESARLQDELALFQRLESVGRLAGGVAHDFNNILTAINGYAELVLAGLAPGDPMAEKVRIIIESGERAADLTGQLLAFSRRQAINPVTLNLNGTIGRVHNVLLRLIGENITVRVQGARDLWNVMADATQMEQVIVNLAINARDAMPRGGEILVETGNIEAGETAGPWSEMIGGGEYVLVRVSDSGTGIAKEVLPHIFEPFFTTKETGKGTGLGLATVYGIVKQNGGYVFVESRVGEGTTFSVLLPRTEAEELEGRPADDAVPRGNQTVLVVEDEGDVRRFIVQVLSDLGYRVIEAGDGAEAMSLLPAAGEVDLLLTDVVMPRMGGEELAEKMESACPGTRVLFMTGYAESFRARGGRETRRAILRKPLSVKRLATAVKEALSPDGGGEESVLSKNIFSCNIPNLSANIGAATRSRPESEGAGKGDAE